MLYEGNQNEAQEMNWIQPYRGLFNSQPAIVSHDINVILFHDYVPQSIVLPKILSGIP